MLSNATSRRDHIRLQSELARSEHRAAQLEADLHRVKAKDAERVLKFADLLVSRIRCSISTSSHNEVLPDEPRVVSSDHIPVFSDGGKPLIHYLDGPADLTRLPVMRYVTIHDERISIRLD
jgi:hypothetical protein